MRLGRGAVVSRSPPVALGVADLVEVLLTAP